MLGHYRAVDRALWVATRLGLSFEPLPKDETWLAWFKQIMAVANLQTHVYHLGLQKQDRYLYPFVVTRPTPILFTGSTPAIDPRHYKLRAQVIHNLKEAFGSPLERKHGRLITFPPAEPWIKEYFSSPAANVSSLSKGLMNVLGSTDEDWWSEGLTDLTRQYYEAHRSAFEGWEFVYLCVGPQAFEVSLEDIGIANTRLIVVAAGQ